MGKIYLKIGFTIFKSSALVITGQFEPPEDLHESKDTAATHEGGPGLESDVFGSTIALTQVLHVRVGTRGRIFPGVRPPDGEKEQIDGIGGHSIVVRNDDQFKALGAQFSSGDRLKEQLFGGQR